MIERTWEAQQATLAKGLVVTPYIVELMCVLERTLNVAHTGNVGVIATSLMNPLWVGRSLVAHGTPTFHPCVKMGHASSQNRVFIPEEQWPRHKQTCQPLTSAKRSLTFNYGIQQWEVRLIPLRFMHHTPYPISPSVDIAAYAINPQLCPFDASRPNLTRTLHPSFVPNPQNCHKSESIDFCPFLRLDLSADFHLLLFPAGFPRMASHALPVHHIALRLVPFSPHMHSTSTSRRADSG